MQRAGRGTARRRRLGIVVVQDATATLDLVADVEDAVVEVDVRPAQAHDLSPAEPHGDSEDEGRVERILAGGREEVERLVEGPWAQVGLIRAGRLDELGDVTRDQFLAAG
jgi:hypothetical protein